jgi:hypothetical protein
MSGGSFNYLFATDGIDLIDECKLRYMKKMYRELIDLGIHDGAKETKKIIDEMELFVKKYDNTMETLSSLWKAVEWECSGDIGEDSLNEKVAEFRKNKYNIDVLSKNFKINAYQFDGTKASKEAICTVFPDLVTSFIKDEESDIIEIWGIYIDFKNECLSHLQKNDWIYQDSKGLFHVVEYF